LSRFAQEHMTGLRFGVGLLLIASFIVGVLR